MASGGMILRLVLAALAAGAAAGILFVLSLFFGAVVASAPESGWAFAPLVDSLQFGLVAGLVILGLPAFFAGALMWALGETYRGARRRPAWAAAGAAVGGALGLLFALLLGSFGRGGRVDPFEAALIAAFLVAGAGGGLVFRGTMRLSERWGGEAEGGRI